MYQNHTELPPSYLPFGPTAVRSTWSIGQSASGTVVPPPPPRRGKDRLFEKDQLKTCYTCSVPPIKGQWNIVTIWLESGDV
ncbi:hypothetical protein K0M31_013098 [Melipona bicolor]|uniref:Uncharacterized protein n=1 Tax=Melipona bicolor TaxID=60889 RepID=A0AA40KGT3_9HYME|nr:hypothetical protein K0M31_013098 [Melipona bicolor]